MTQMTMTTIIEQVKQLSTEKDYHVIDGFFEIILLTNKFTFTPQELKQLPTR